VIADWMVPRRATIDGTPGGPTISKVATAPLLDSTRTVSDPGDPG
jgi:hypothetical protein